MATDHKKILEALEKAAREDFASQYHPVQDTISDQRSANWGPLTDDVLRHLANPISHGRAVRALHAMVVAGLVLKAKPHPMQVRWWPVGLYEKLRQERAAQEGGA